MNRNNFFLLTYPISLCPHGWFCPTPHPPRGHLTISWDKPGCHNLERGTAGIQWVEARGAAKHPTMHKTASPHHPSTRNYLVQNVTNAKAEKSAVFFLYAHIHRHSQNDYRQWQRKGRIADISSLCSFKSHQQFRNLFSQTLRSYIFIWKIEEQIPF